MIKKQLVKKQLIKKQLVKSYEQVETGAFWISETILYDDAVVDIRHYAFVKIHEMYTTKSEP